MFEDDDDESLESEVEGETSSDEENETDPLVSIDQWVKTIDSISVRSNFSGDAVRKNLGVEKLCRTDDENRDLGWILFNDNREETLVVSFEMPVFINEIFVYESFNSGSVVQLEMFEAERRKIFVLIEKDSFFRGFFVSFFRKILDDVEKKWVGRKFVVDFHATSSTFSNSIENNSIDFRSATCRSFRNQIDSSV